MTFTLWRFGWDWDMKDDRVGDHDFTINGKTCEEWRYLGWGLWWRTG